MIENAILKTVLYADIFYYALTIKELQYFLISECSVELNEIHHHLQHSLKLQQVLCVIDGFVALSHRADLIRIRQEREQIAQQLLPKAHHYADWLGRIPFVRMVALTGALSMSNPASLRDDVDYLLVVEEGRVWLARAIAIILVRWARLWGVELCPNYVLATNRLAQTRQDLYIAHEITQMIPLYDEQIYAQIMQMNTWAQNWLPNSLVNRWAIQSKTSSVKYLAEWILSGRFGQWLETWEYKRKQHKFTAKSQTKASSAEIDANTVKGHFNDHGQRILAQYEAKLIEYDLVSLS
jgi:hypothetical protein